MLFLRNRKCGFHEFRLKGNKYDGKSHFTKIVIEPNATDNYIVFCQGITLYYEDKPAYQDHKHPLIMNQIKIIGEDAGN